MSRETSESAIYCIVYSVWSTVFNVTSSLTCNDELIVVGHVQPPVHPRSINSDVIPPTIVESYPSRLHHPCTACVRVL